MLALAVLVLSVVPPHSSFAVDRVERFENNVFYDEQGREVFTQLIGWDEMNIAFWRMNKLGDLNPVRERGAWVVRWNDQGVMREVWARSFDTTWTQHDVELVDREYVPPEKRRGLKH